MKTPLVVLAIGLTATGCHRPDPQPEPRSALRIASAYVSGEHGIDRHEIASMRERVTKRAALEREKLAEDKRVADQVAAQGAYDVAVAKANGEYKTTVESCTILASKAQRNCRARADEELHIAKAQAEELKPSS